MTNSITQSFAAPEPVADRVRNVRVVPTHRWYLPLKALLDFALAAVLLVFCTPFIVVSAIIIKFTSPGPVFYCQTRLGKGGRLFKVIKLRTMIHNAEAKTGPVWTQSGDPRVTKFGAFLRASHIDEFPQLLNVLMGQMSLVGPRPERPEIADKLAWSIEHYDERLAVRPGITGLAQLRLPPDSDLESVRRKLACDLYYVRQASPWLDLKLFVFTGWLFASTLFKAVWRRIYVPDARMISENVSDLFRDGIDFKSPAEDRH